MTFAGFSAGLARAGLLFAAASICGVGRAAQSPDNGVRAVLDAALDASGLDRRSHEIFEDRFNVLAHEVAERAGTARSPEARARRLHKLLHREVLLRYQDDADGLDDVLGRGEFNCVSATLLEGLLAETIGLDARIVSRPSHIALQLLLRAHTVEIETTVPDGFDWNGRAAASARFLLAAGAASADASPMLALQDMTRDARGRTFPLSSGPAFIWHNVAARQLSRGEGRAAASSLLAGERLYPRVATGPEGIQTELGRAFRADYDAGRFDDAYATAAVGVLLGPGVVSAHDRLIAAAAQRIEAAADRGDIQGAEGVLEDVDGLLGASAVRFDRHMLPTVVAAAVRVGDWERAECLSERDEKVELDPIESERLAAWVRERHAAASGR